MFNYTYDSQDRFISIRKNRTLQSWFSYDDDGRRVKIVDGQRALFHVYYALDIVYEKEGTTIKSTSMRTAFKSLRTGAAP